MNPQDRPVDLGSKRVYPGEAGMAAARETYDGVVGEWLGRGRMAPPEGGIGP